MSCVCSCRGEVISKAGAEETVIYADIGECLQAEAIVAPQSIVSRCPCADSDARCRRWQLCRERLFIERWKDSDRDRKRGVVREIDKEIRKCSSDAASLCRRSAVFEWHPAADPDHGPAAGRPLLCDICAGSIGLILLLKRASASPGFKSKLILIWKRDELIQFNAGSEWSYSVLCSAALTDYSRSVTTLMRSFISSWRIRNLFLKVTVYKTDFKMCNLQ